MKIAIVGATGMVGREMLTVLANSSINVEELYPVASKKCLGNATVGGLGSHLYLILSH